MRRRYKRDYIILESKDLSFRLKDKVVPKAFAKLELKEDKGSCMIYVENLKYTKEGYRIIVIEDNLNTKDVGRVLVNESGKGEFVLNFNEESFQVKGIALVYDKNIPLIGFKGGNIDNYQDVLFRNIKEEKVEEITLEQNRIDIDSIKEPIEEKIDMDEEYIARKDIEVKEEMQIKHEQEDIEEYEGKEEVIIERKDDIDEKKKDEEKQERQERKENQEKEIFEDKVYLVPRKIKKYLNRHKEVKPFIKDMDDIKWWKIDISPISLCGYSMPYLGYINYINYTIYSDVTMLSYKYRHYIFGIKYFENGKRKYYVYGVPGTKYEQPDDGDTGFSYFAPCDKKNDGYGYWLCFIECKSRLIAMYDE